MHIWFTQLEKQQREIRRVVFRNFIYNVNVNMNPDNWGGVFERRTSIGSEAFYLLNLYWYLSLPS